jgi:O-acetyl-ADP-ribose deacetylase (regulator of RNase III)
MLDRLILVDPNLEVDKAWHVHFDDTPGVEIVQGRFEMLPRYDCMVSAANSFGLMDGGVDLAITRFFGVELMDRVQERIVRDWLGEQPVGTSMLVETGHSAHPWLAHTPTMRVPQDIRGTDHVYLAMLAMLRAVAEHERSGAQPPIRTVACPGLGTATGRVPPLEAARQMRVAWQSYVDPITAISWPVAHQRDLNARWRPRQ